MTQDKTTKSLSFLSTLLVLEKTQSVDHQFSYLIINSTSALTMLFFQTTVSGINGSSQQSSSSGGSHQLLHQRSQSHVVCQCGHCEYNSVLSLLLVNV